MKKVKHEIRTKEKHNQNLIRITFVQHLFQNLVIHFNTLIQNTHLTKREEGDEYATPKFCQVFYLTCLSNFLLK